MFNNIGRKIKSLAEILCWIGIFLSVIMSISVFKISVLFGLLVIVLGALASWIGSFLLYGFGELIEKTSDIAEHTARISKNSKATDPNMINFDEI